MKSNTSVEHSTHQSVEKSVIHIRPIDKSEDISKLKLVLKQGLPMARSRMETLETTYTESFLENRYASKERKNIIANMERHRILKLIRNQPTPKKQHNHEYFSKTYTDQLIKS